MANGLKKTMIAAVALAAGMAAHAAPTTVKAAIDSTTMLMGNKTAVRVTVVKDKSVSGDLALPDDSLVWKVEIAAKPDTTMTDVGNNREQINYTIPVQVFDPGEYVIPGIKFVAGTDTVVSNTLSLKVTEVDVSDLEKNDSIYDYKGVENPISKFWDFLPDNLRWLWWTLGILAFLAVAAVGYWMYRRWQAGKPVLPFIPVKPVLPPYEEAVAALAELKAKKLVERGDVKGYYTHLTDIVRRYISRRYEIGAMEMTSRQIMRAVEELGAVAGVERLEELLETADFVKFAKMSPLADENERSFANASSFVEANKPVEQAPEEAAKELKAD